MAEGLIAVVFVIPNRDDPEKPPTLYESCEVVAVPREGETVILHEKSWRVKWVEYDFDQVVIRVRLIEPDHWLARGPDTKDTLSQASPGEPQPDAS